VLRKMRDGDVIRAAGAEPLFHWRQGI